MSIKIFFIILQWIRIILFCSSNIREEIGNCRVSFARFAYSNSLVKNHLYYLDMQKKHLFLILLIFGTSFWGVSFTFVKVGIGNGSPFTFLFYKFLIAAIILSILFFKKLNQINRHTVMISFFIAVPLCAGNVLQSIGLKFTSVSNSAFLTGLDVLLIPILKFFVYKKKVDKKIWPASVLALIGLYLIVAKNGLSLNVGDIWIITCAFAFAFYVLQVGKYADLTNPMPSVILVMTFCAFGCLLGALIDPNSKFISGDFDFWKGVLFAAIFATAYMYSIQNLAQRFLSEEKIAMTYLFEPVVATSAGILILGEPFSKELIIGGSLIIISMLIVEVKISPMKIIRSNDSLRNSK